MQSEHMRYLGVLGLLGECSVYVPEDIRESIEAAFNQACAANPRLAWNRVLDRLDIHVANVSAQLTAEPSTEVQPNPKESPDGL